MFSGAVGMVHLVFGMVYVVFRYGEWVLGGMVATNICMVGKIIYGIYGISCYLRYGPKLLNRWSLGGP